MKTKSLCFLMVLAGAVAGFSQATLQFSASSYTVAESAGAVTLIVQRTGDTNPAVTVDYATVDGTATNGIKYTAVSGPLVFAVGETTQTISVPILNDGLVQGTKNFRVILSNPTAEALLATRTNIPVNITDNDVGIQFQFPTNSVSEDAGTVILRVVRDDDGTNAVAVDFATSNLTGTSGVDYLSFTNTLMFAPQERVQLVFVPILNNAIKQGNRTFRATLTNPVNGSLGNQRIATITILDNDQGFAFESATYSVAEDAGVARINVLRGTDDTNSTVSVDFATTDLSATNGLDYIGLTNTLAFAPGERLKQVTVPILNDGVKEANKNFRVTLSNPRAGAVLGSRTIGTVTIVDNDPGVGFEFSSYSVWENAGTLTVNVLRGNDVALGPITVDYATSNLSAQAGQDYQAVSGALVFQQDEIIKTVNIPIIRDTLVANNTNFRITLSNPTVGTLLGSASATVTIVNAKEPGIFRTVAPPFDTALTIRREGDLNILSWAGAGQLQRADNPNGPWQTILTATNPYTVQSPVPATYYRVTRPRPVNLYVPSGYDSQTPLPLVFLLHGYGWTGADMENWMHFQPFAESRGFLYCYPDSGIDPAGGEFWNGTDSCCDQWNVGIDDAGYLRALIEEIGQQFALDRKRVFLIGHSNGGYLSYHTACENADLIAGIASVSGSTFLEPGQCNPPEPVNILQIHGTSDEWQFYWGGANRIGGGADATVWRANLPPFPSAPQSVQTWAKYNGANSPVTDPTPTLDLTTDVAGLETVVTRYTNAPPGGAIELWTMVGGTHFPNLTTQFAPHVLDWLFAHPKP